MRVLRHVSLFSGIGGIDIAAERAGFTTVLFCECDPYCQAVLRKHWPGVPIIDDVRKVNRESVNGGIDLISGGFPCQPVSCAGKRLGKGDDRWLWPEMLRVVAELRPRWVLGENVAGLLSMGIDGVLSDLEGIGYEVQPFVIPACAVNAPHRRDRVFIVAHRDGNGTRERHDGKAIGGNPREIRGGRDSADTQDSRTDTDNCRETLADTGFVAGGAGLREARPEHYGSQPRDGSAVADADRTRLEIGDRGNATGGACAAPHEPGWWSVEPGLGRVAHGVPNRVDRLRCLGNAVVPAQVYPILKAIADIETTAHPGHEGQLWGRG
jgi:DNA (cytosine-5)-methyltransferase 1